MDYEEIENLNKQIYHANRALNEAQNQRNMLLYSNMYQQSSPQVVYQPQIQFQQPTSQLTRSVSQDFWNRPRQSTEIDQFSRPVNQPLAVGNINKPTSQIVIPINKPLQETCSSSTTTTLSNVSSFNSFHPVQSHMNAPEYQPSGCSGRSIDKTKLFIGNLPASTRLSELLALFKKYGPVNEKLSVVKDQNYAFIHFYEESDAKRALDEVNDSLFKDRYIRVQYSTSQGHVKKSKSK